MKKKRPAVKKRPKAKRMTSPVSLSQAVSVFTKPVDVLQESQRLRLVQEALERAQAEDRRRLAEEVAADLEAAKPHTAWERLQAFARKHLGGPA